jgi:hypothetical protein
MLLLFLQPLAVGNAMAKSSYYIIDWTRINQGGKGQGSTSICCPRKTL